MFESLVAVLDYLPRSTHEVALILASLAIAVAVALTLHFVLFRLLRRIARASTSPTDDLIIEKVARPARYAILALAVATVAGRIPQIAEIWDGIAGFLMPALVGWIAIAVLNGLIKAVEMRVDIAQADNLSARRRLTRLAIFSRMATFIVVFATLGLMLLSIPGVREVGVTLMASAGIAGLAVGAAAQPALKSLIAGVQMAITEPINIDDVVVIGGQWGRVEDIRSTYVVVRTWDERRLIVPTVKFLDETFENWTRNGSELLAPILLYFDPLTEIEPLREEFKALVQAHPLWDGREAKLQVTDSTATAIQVRLLASAANSGQAFDLRCEIREALLAWVRTNQPQAIVRSRVESKDLPSPAVQSATDLREN